MVGQTGPFRALHHINPVRLEYINERCGLKGKGVIDVGCGGGILSEAMAKRGAAVTGIDMDGAALAAADEHGTRAGLSIDYKMGTVEQVAEKEAGAWDVVTCLELLEHVPDPASVVYACSRLVRPGGDLFRNRKPDDCCPPARHPRFRISSENCSPGNPHLGEIHTSP